MSEIQSRSSPTSGPDTDQCPNCGSLNVRVEQREDHFLYGVGEQAADLTALVPMHICADCGLEYTNEIGERLRHESVCRHLGILSPTEIIAIRERRGLSRRQFAAVTRIGLASLSRWEAGDGNQNPAMDVYLRLLAHTEVFEIVARSEFATNRTLAPSPRKFPAFERLNPLRQAHTRQREGVFEIDRARATA